MHTSIAMARGTIFLDEDSLHLESALKEQNIRVLKAKPGTKDEELIESMTLANRILITNNSKDFKYFASSLDMGIIALDNLSSSNDKMVVQKISQAIIKLSLWAKRHGFIVYLYDNKDPKYEELTY